MEEDCRGDRGYGEDGKKCRKGLEEMDSGEWEGRWEYGGRGGRGGRGMLG